VYDHFKYKYDLIEKNHSQHIIFSIIDHLTVTEKTHSDINQKHDLINVIFLIIIAIFSRCEEWQDIEICGDENLLVAKSKGGLE